jgi:folate-binding protein YgfZ
MTPGLHALLNDAALVDLTARGRIRVTGEDAARLLHAMTTNHVQGMQPGEGLYVFFLNAQGKILADANLFRFADHFLIDTEPETRQKVFQHLDQYIIADDVSLEDISESTSCISLEGPRALARAKDLGIPEPAKDLAHVQWDDHTIAALSVTGEPGLRIFGPVFQLAGIEIATVDDAEAARIMHYRPRYGDEIDERSLPQETQQMRAVHLSKGCYLGQEIVERIRSRGHVNRVLMGFHGESADAPPPGSVVTAMGKEAGEVASSVSVDGKFYGLGYIRAAIAKPGEIVGIEGRPAQLTATF